MAKSIEKTEVCPVCNGKGFVKDAVVRYDCPYCLGKGSIVILEKRTKTFVDRPILCSQSQFADETVPCDSKIETAEEFKGNVE